ncbi:MAG TPA: hypothetical protein VGN17_30480 [Bryobacteraceae bacterium]|jgi:uncharacterized protein (TIGR03437 family)
MKSIRIAAAAAFILAAGVQAATINTTWTVTNATVSISGNDFAVSGPCTLTNIGSGTVSATVSLTGGQGASAPFTITLSGGAGTLTGNISGTLLTSLVSSGSGVGSATITGGTGTYAGATGSFPNLSGSGTFNGFSGSVSLNGSGTINTNGGGTSTPTPTISQVLDAGSYTSSVAQGSVFVVKGTNLSPTGYTPFSFPLPTSSGGVSINLTPLGGGTATPAYLIYLYNVGGVNQLAAVLPSTVAVGTYNVTVTAGGQTSGGATLQVVGRKLSLITADGSGNGLAVVQNYISATQLDVNRFTTGTINGVTVSPLHPGQIGIAYTVGMGADPNPSNQASPGYNFLANGLKVLTRFGGSVVVTPAYAGRVAGGSGYEQINFTVPATVPTGCTVTFEVSADNGATWGVPTFVAIAPSASANVCVQPGYSTADLQAFDNGTKVVYDGGFSLQQFSATVGGVGSVSIASASGGFTKYTGTQLSAIPANIQTLITQNGCIVGQGTGGASGVGAGIGLDAGAVTLTGPSGSSITSLALTELNNAYSLTPLPSGAKLVAGNYTLNVAGGTDVGKTSAAVSIPNPVTVTGGLPSSVNRGAGLVLGWTGGNPTDLVEVAGGSGSSATNLTTFICITTAGQGGITVPASILTQLPATGSGFGSLEVLSFTSPSGSNGQFSAPLTAGGSISSTFSGLVGTGGQPSYQ